MLVLAIAVRSDSVLALRIETTPVFEGVDRLNTLQSRRSWSCPCGDGLNLGIPALAHLVWIFFGQTAFHVVQPPASLFAEEFHLLLAGWAPVRTKKLGVYGIELISQLDRLCCGFRCGFGDRLVPGLCSHLQASPSCDESQTGQDVDASDSAHRTLLNTVF